MSGREISILRIQYWRREKAWEGEREEKEKRRVIWRERIENENENENERWVICSGSSSQ